MGIEGDCDDFIFVASKGVDKFTSVGVPKLGGSVEATG